MIAKSFSSRAARAYAGLALLIPLVAIHCKPRQQQQSDEPFRSPEQIGAPPVPSSAVDSDGSVVSVGGAGEKLYFERCKSCHGLTGSGDGPALAALKLKHKPRDWTVPNALKDIPDDEMRKTILYGGAGVGKSPDMPPFGDLQGKDAQLDALMKYARAFGKN